MWVDPRTPDAVPTIEVDYLDPAEPLVLYGPGGEVLSRVWDPVGFTSRGGSVV